MASNSFSITNKTKGRLPSLPFEKMKDFILGKNYSLSLVFVSDARSKNLNKKYRKKDRVTNILSFPIDKDTGEIFICANRARSDAKKFDTTQNKFIGYLFIHGLLHLKGYAHGSRMDSKEKALRKRFNV